MKTRLNAFSTFFLTTLTATGCTVGYQEQPTPYDAAISKESPSLEVEDLDRDRGSYFENELDRALQRLVDDLELAVLGVPGSEPSGDKGPGGVHLVKSGEYLDLIIEKTLPNSPIRESLLRKAFVQLNPHAFGGNGNPNYLFARQKLKIPSVDDLRAIIFKEEQMEKVKHQMREPNQGWISYP